MTDKEELYSLLYRQAVSLTEGEQDAVANMANISALLMEALPDINWAGFYRFKNGELVLGPFQGKTACVHIPLGKGVCGTAFVGNRTELVEDVLAFPGHIACDSASRSKIVIPLHDGGGMPIGVLDIDSPVKSRFDGTDRRGLEKIAGLLEKVCQWNG